MSVSSPTTAPSFGAVMSTLAALLLGYASMQMGNTLQGTLLGVRGDMEGFDAAIVGFVGAAFWAGVVAGSLRAGALIRRVGHTRTFAALAAIASTAALLHLLVMHPIAWIATRALTGFCFAGLFMTVESWLNAAATAENRGRVLGLYGMAGLVAGIGGQMLLTTVDTAGFAAFCIVAVLISLALVPVAVSGASAPAHAVGEARIDLVGLYRGSPFGVVAAALCGFTTASFFALAPLLLANGGMEGSGIAFVMASATLGGFLMSWPMGRLSDRIDRRIVAVSMAGIAAIVLPLLVNLVPADAGLVVVCACAAIFGASVMPTYGIVAAHVNDTVQPGDYVSAAGGLLVLQGLGATLGPIVSGAAMSAAGAMGLAVAMAAAQALVLGWGLWRMRQRPAPPPEEKGSFAIAPAVPVGTALHPEVDAEAEAAELIADPKGEKAREEAVMGVS
jgi:MFS family permease